MYWHRPKHESDLYPQNVDQKPKEYFSYNHKTRTQSYRHLPSFHILPEDGRTSLSTKNFFLKPSLIPVRQLISINWYLNRNKIHRLRPSYPKKSCFFLLIDSLSDSLCYNLFLVTWTLDLYYPKSLTRTELSHTCEPFQWNWETRNERSKHFTSPTWSTGNSKEDQNY